MSSMRPRRATLAALLAVPLLLAVLGAPALVRAADVTFDTPASSVTYGERIEFTVGVTSAAPLTRAELRLEFPGALGPLIVDVPTGPAAEQTLRYTLDLAGGGHLVPNTPITATWAAFTAADEDPVVSGSRTVRYADTSQEWQTLRGDLVVVHWYAGGEAFARKALEIGDRAVKETADLLGVTETEPIDFFIYGDQAAFRTALGPGTRENVGGQAHADIRTLFALIEPGAINDPWVGIVIPHELVHLVFDTAVSNPYRFPPRWLNEGLAVYLSEGYGSGDRGRVRDAVESRDLIPLIALGGQFPTDAQKTSLAYSESVSAIDYLVRAYDEAALIDLVLAYEDGLTDDEAFEKALGVDLAAFQAGWLREIGADAPERFGPVSPPPGPLPSGWSGPAPTSAPERSPDGAPGETPAMTPSAGGDGGPRDEVAGLSLPLMIAGLVLVAAALVLALVLAQRRAAPR